MQHILQTALSAGFSATSGVHGKTPKPVDPSFDGSQFILPPSFLAQPTDRFILRGKYHNAEASYLSIGAWAWGDTATWHWSPEEEPHVVEAWSYLFQNGVNYIDTAQAYGSGESERIIGRLIKSLPRDKLILQTKYYPVADNLANILTPASAPLKMLKDSLERMGTDYVDVYMVHGHIHLGSIKQVAQGLAECVEQKLARTIAVANYGVEDMLQMKEALAEYNIPLALNQCEYSVIRRLPETEGMMTACKNNGIVFQAYSALAQGRLSGKWRPGKEPPKEYRFSSYNMEDLQPTLEVLDRIAAKRGKSVAAVSLNYVISKGVIPVVGVRKLEQAKQNFESLGWRLSNEEMEEIDAVSLEGETTKLWQQG